MNAYKKPDPQALKLYIPKFMLPLEKTQFTPKKLKKTLKLKTENGPDKLDLLLNKERRMLLLKLKKWQVVKND